VGTEGIIKVQGSGVSVGKSFYGRFDCRREKSSRQKKKKTPIRRGERLLDDETGKKGKHK